MKGGGKRGFVRVYVEWGRGEGRGMEWILHGVELRGGLLDERGIEGGFKEEV